MTKIKSRKFCGKVVGLALAAVLAFPSLAHASDFSEDPWSNLHWVGWNFETVGTNVRAVQRICTDEGFGSTIGTIDGYYGNNTYNGIVAYQSKFGLPADGTVGSQTWTVMRSGLVFSYQLGVWEYVYTYKGGPGVFELCNYTTSNRWRYQNGTFIEMDYNK